MIQKLKNIIVALTIAVSGTIVLVPVVANADFKSDACQGVNTLSGSGGAACDTTAGATLNGIIRTVIQVFSIIVGFVAVIMIIVGGLRFMTANGDSSAIASARSSIIYALIGLVIVAISQVLVHFVLKKVG